MRPANWIQQYINRILQHIMVKGIICPRNIVNIIHHINRLRKKSHVIILISRKNISQKLNPFLIKTLNALEIIGKFLNLIKDIYEKPTISIIFHSKGLNAKKKKDWMLSPRIRIRVKMSALISFIAHYTRDSCQCYWNK